MFKKIFLTNLLFVIFFNINSSVSYGSTTSDENTNQSNNSFQETSIAIKKIDALGQKIECLSRFMLFSEFGKRVLTRIDEIRLCKQNNQFDSENSLTAKKNQLCFDEGKGALNGLLHSTILFNLVLLEIDSLLALLEEIISYETLSKLPETKIEELLTNLEHIQNQSKEKRKASCI